MLRSTAEPRILPEATGQQPDQAFFFSTACAVEVAVGIPVQISPAVFRKFRDIRGSAVKPSPT
jgi:hypothetical protein